jgi:hypothetical protein
MTDGARIPYGTWGSSYFPAWQTSALAQVNIGQFAGEAMARIRPARVPRGGQYWSSARPSLALEVLDRALVAAVSASHPRYHVEQACATGLQACCRRALR